MVQRTRQIHSLVQNPQLQVVLHTFCRVMHRVQHSSTLVQWTNQRPLEALKQTHARLHKLLHTSKHLCTTPTKMLTQCNTSRKLALVCNIMQGLLLSPLAMNIHRLSQKHARPRL